MLTPEQIKNLKPGDPLIIHGTFAETAADGDVCVKVPMSLHSFVDNNNINYVHPSAVSIVKPKHDPCRLFKKGDIVQYVERDGRSYGDAPPAGATCCVCVGEDGVGLVSVEFKFSENEEPAVHDVPFYHLKLITPVEELEPYSVHATMIHDGWQIVRDGLPLALYDAQRHPNAKEAAEAECARLNAEYRKEREND